MLAEDALASRKQWVDAVDFEGGIIVVVDVRNDLRACSTAQHIVVCYSIVQ